MVAAACSLLFTTSPKCLGGRGPAMDSGNPGESNRWRSWKDGILKRKMTGLSDKMKGEKVSP